MDQYGYGWNIPRRGIVRVHGEEGARSLQMLPGDEEYIPKPPVSLDDFDARLRRMEEFI